MKLNEKVRKKIINSIDRTGLRYTANFNLKTEEVYMIGSKIPTNIMLMPSITVTFYLRERDLE